jgi:hypothetical protein
MNDSGRPYIGPHDLGGRDAGAVEPAERELAHWERQIDALVMLLFTKNIFANAAQLRKGVEALDPKTYAKLGLYERWASSAASKCVERGIVTQAELDERIQKIKARGYR